VQLQVQLWQYLSRAYGQVGDFRAAFTTWEQLAKHYQHQGDPQRWGQALTEQAQTLNHLGRPVQALELLCNPAPGSLAVQCQGDSAVAVAKQTGDRPGQIAALGSLGNTYRLLSQYALAYQALDTALNLTSRSINNVVNPPEGNPADGDHDNGDRDDGDRDNGNDGNGGSEKVGPREIQVEILENHLSNLYRAVAQQSHQFAQFARQSGDYTAEQQFRQQAQTLMEQAIEVLQANSVRSSVQTQINLAIAIQTQKTWQGTSLDMAQDSNLESWATAGGDHPLDPLSRDSLLSLNQLLPDIQTAIDAMPPSRTKAQHLLQLAVLLEQNTIITNADSDPSSFNFPTAIAPCLDQPFPLNNTIPTLIRQALVIAKATEDPTTQAFAAGQLGHYYECRHDYDQAWAWTQQTQLAQLSPGDRYRWEWQLARIYQALGQNQAALATYTQAVQTLEQVRTELTAAQRDSQLDFRSAIEPVYRQLLSLQIQQVRQHSQKLDLNQALQTALQTLDQLRLAELQNYLGGECDLPEAIDSGVTPPLKANTALLHSIILPEGVALILTIPNSPDQNSSEQDQAKNQSYFHWLPIPATELREQVNQFRLALEQRGDFSHRYRHQSQQFYNWLMQPFEERLDQAEIETLVFRQDGILRSIPMATLYDGQQFLVERYAIAYTTTLTTTADQVIDNDKLQVLAFGLADSAQVAQTSILQRLGLALNRPSEPEHDFFPPLNKVKTEVEWIAKYLSGSKALLNQDFSLERMEGELAVGNYSILHLATHAQFGYDGQRSFLVTGDTRNAENTENIEDIGEIGENRKQRFNRRLTLNGLYHLLQSQGERTKVLELLVLTACETAVGSDRDALGLAGIALQAGVESAVATLWQIDDRATQQIITDFYQGLAQGLSKAEALQQAQVNWLQHHATAYDLHPGYWAAFALLD
jgi:CHAT domain-containing protein/tetratricopeptide (TPR) repeat protein